MVLGMGSKRSTARSKRPPGALRSAQRSAPVLRSQKHAIDARPLAHARRHCFQATNPQSVAPDSLAESGDRHILSRWRRLHPRRRGHRSIGRSGAPLVSRRRGRQSIRAASSRPTVLCRRSASPAAVQLADRPCAAGVCAASQVVEVESANYDAVCTTNPCYFNIAVPKKMVCRHSRHETPATRALALPAAALARETPETTETALSHRLALTPRNLANGVGSCS